MGRLREKSEVKIEDEEREREGEGEANSFGDIRCTCVHARRVDEGANAPSYRFFDEILNGTSLLPRDPGAILDPLCEWPRERFIPRVFTSGPRDYSII